MILLLDIYIRSGIRSPRWRNVKVRPVQEEERRPRNQDWRLCLTPATQHHHHHHQEVQDHQQGAAEHQDWVRDLPQPTLAPTIQSTDTPTNNDDLCYNSSNTMLSSINIKINHCLWLQILMLLSQLCVTRGCINISGLTSRLAPYTISGTLQSVTLYIIILFWPCFVTHPVERVVSDICC